MSDLTTRFARPASIAEALDLLGGGAGMDEGGNADPAAAAAGAGGRPGWALLAGGTDLYAAHVGVPVAAPLLDLTGIAALRGIRRDAAGWSIGATTTWADVRRADLPPLFDAYKQAAREVGGVQVQNAGTVAGNLCNASPAADGTPVLLALDARVVLQHRGGESELAVDDFVLGARRTALKAGELVTALRVPGRGEQARSVFIKLGGRSHLTISITMVAVVVDLDAAGRVAYAGVAVGSCAARARRLPRLEARLLGRPLAALAGLTVDAADLAPLTPIDDLRASAAYRRDATATLLRRALQQVASDRLAEVATA